MNSGNQHDRGRNQLLTVPPEVPRRPLITTTRPIVSTTTTEGSLVNVTARPSQTTNPIIREIHKNAWLKCLHKSYDKKGVPSVKRSEKWWVVFCVHDDAEAYLEFYTDPKMGTLHKPVNRINLSTCLHVSPSIMGQENEYEFAVTLQSLVVRLAASDWEQMSDWVESLQGKLREMNILSPKDNLYSKLPEIRNCSVSNIASSYGFGSTRDPNSPLPLPPSISSATVAIQSETTYSPIDNDRDLLVDYIDTNLGAHSTTEIGSSNLHQMNISLPGARVESSASVYIQSSSNGSSNFRDVSNSDSGSGSGVSMLSVSNSMTSSTSGSIQTHINAATNLHSLEIVSPSTVGVVVGGNNSTLVQIGFEHPSQSGASSVEHLSAPQSKQKCIRRLIPKSNTRKFKTDPGLNFGMPLVPSFTEGSNSFSRQHSTPIESSTSSQATATSTENLYEHLFLDVVATPNNSEPNNIPPPQIPRRNPSGNRLQRRLQQQFEIRRSPSSSDAQNFDGSNGSHTECPPQDMDPLDGIIGVRSGEYRIASRREIPTTGSSENPSTTDNLSIGPIAYVPLKESQVIRLQSEINHRAGVRIVLRKKDCLNTIAFVDYLGAVWIAGWKQQQHPVLYYAFHVGDQIVKIGGEKVQTSEETRKGIHMNSSNQVEFIIRRLPYGQVFVLKRRTEGEPLGLVAIGNCAEISEVLPNSLAAAEGLPPKASSVDGHSVCNWFLTEINNRPLSLVARESEVRDRLNAVGKEISILVQPSDLVRHLKKQLKTMKGYKEYLVV